MSPSHLSHSELTRLAAISFDEFPEHAVLHLAECESCASEFVAEVDAAVMSAELVGLAAQAGWRPSQQTLAEPLWSWPGVLGLAAAAVLGLYTAPPWALHWGTKALTGSAHAAAGLVRAANGSALGSPWVLVATALVALSISKTSKGEAHV